MAYIAINRFRGLFKDVEKTFPVPAGDEYGLKVEFLHQKHLLQRVYMHVFQFHYGDDLLIHIYCYLTVLHGFRSWLPPQTL